MRQIAIISCCLDDWGGSEDLWARIIPFLKERGFTFTLYKRNIAVNHPEISALAELGVKLVCLNKYEVFSKRVIQKIKTKARQFFRYTPDNPIAINQYPLFLRKQMQKNPPDFALVVQGINFDGLDYAFECKKLGIPYAIFVNKGVDFYWPPGIFRSEMIEVFKSSKKNFFCSKHNLQLTEEQFGFRFENSKVVWNDVKISRNALKFPTIEGTIKFACVGRLFIIDKGQDILFRILSKEPWKSRNIEVSLVGKGPDEEALKDMATLKNITNVQFIGHQQDISEIWQTHHALLLPSRSEGMALSVIEAMAAGRPVIVTNAGGHAEIVRNGVNGFISDATETAFAANMEEAWAQKDRWEEIGKRANAFVNDNVPANPVKEFAMLILNLIDEN